MLLNSSPSIAFTFDDLPGASLPRGSISLQELNQLLLAELEAQGIRAVGFVCPYSKDRCAAPVRSDAEVQELCKLWLDGGHALGNHTYTHKNYNDTPLSEYTEDISSCEKLLVEIPGYSAQKFRYFRWPYLKTGLTREARQDLKKFLSHAGFAAGPVTVDNEDWIFAEAYARAFERNDKKLQESVLENYLSYTERVLEYYKELSERVLGYELPHILLLHNNYLNSLHLGELFSVIKGRGYSFIGVDEALEDPAYGSEDTYVGKNGLGWLERWANAKGLSIKEKPVDPEYTYMEELLAGNFCQNSHL